MKTNTPVYRRQGDWLFKPAESLPQDIHQIKSNVVGEGEATGHLHQFSNGQVVLYADKNGETAAVEVKSESATLAHPEHGPISFEKGLYVTKKELEYSPMLEQMQKVMD